MVRAGPDHGRLVVRRGEAVEPRTELRGGHPVDLAIEFGKSILRRFDIDWSAVGFDGDALDQLVEFMLRTLQSFIIDPGGPSRRDSELRTYLRDWVAPAVSARTTYPSSPAP
ncbi:hypothetical protein [Mycobacterium sp. NPDC004974]